MRRPLVLLGFVPAALALLAGSVGATAKPKAKPLAKVKHIVVIYEENHSFDNLYGGWEGVNGRTRAPASHTTQVNEAGTPYSCLLQDDVNLASQPATCTDTTTGTTFTSHFANSPFSIDMFIPPSATTCPPPQQAFSFPNGVKNGSGLPGGCTRDLVHEFYQEQYQLNEGQQNRYVTGSDAVGLTMGYYNTKALPIYRYLHARRHPHYAILDNFFQGAFGGSFLNHQWLIAAATPTYPSPPANLRSIIDSNGMPVRYPLYTPTGPVRRGPITVACPSPVPGRACGDFAVNTMQPPYQPSGTFGAKLVPQTNPTIGDRLTAKGLSWDWYSGGWNDAAAGHPDPLFQFHHQPFNYYANYAPGTPGRAHLRDETEFMQAAAASKKRCGLPAVSFVKPIGEENEHPGYASEPNGSSHLVALVNLVERSACAKSTLLVVTYDEFGGQWDHVSPPGQGGKGGPHDEWGPGTRIPALVISPLIRKPFVVDHVEHDTTSILSTIEHRWGLAPLSSRDRAAHDLASVFKAKAAKLKKKK